jgi:hypothetical protein
VLDQERHLRAPGARPSRLPGAGNMARCPKILHEGSRFGWCWHAERAASGGLRVGGRRAPRLTTSTLATNATGIAHR